jgi:hypothetical protein
VPEKSDELLQAIDAAAITLLSKAVGSATLPPDVNPGILADQVKTFEAIVEWAKVRHSIEPPPAPPKKESAFAGIKSRLSDGPAPRRRGGKSAPAPNGHGGEPVALGDDNSDQDTADAPLDP